MAEWKLDPADIAELATPVAMRGSLRADEIGPDDIFEIIVAIANVTFGIH
nr:hypothetical protein [Sphingosinithalassobacter portus]